MPTYAQLKAEIDALRERRVPFLAGKEVTDAEISGLIVEVEHAAEEFRQMAANVPGDASYSGNGREMRKRWHSRAARLYRAAVLLDHAREHFFGERKAPPTEAELVRDEEEI